MSNKPLFMPSILKETNRGVAQYEIMDAMFQNREILCTQEIDSTSVTSLILQMHYLEQEDAEKEITVYINSPGGEVSAGLALYDVIQEISCPVRTVCIGTAASMGAILFLAGKKRQMLPHSRIMIHDPSYHGELSGTAGQIQTINEEIQKHRMLLAEIIAKSCKKTVDDVYEMTAQDTYFNAQEALDFGIATQIIETI